MPLTRCPKGFCVNSPEKMPILLDDVFNRYDDARMKTAVDFLGQFAKENQILFFTCHLTLKEEAEKRGAKTVLLGQ